MKQLRNAAIILGQFRISITLELFPEPNSHEPVMRINQPITQRAYDYPDDMTLMSTTDLESHLTYANAAFIEVSGFEREELMSQPHNMVRHPDMPVEAFADMWNTLKAGRSWSALVKNRRKNGDHYWVRANATPVIRQGQHVGYMSVRTKPSGAEIEQAERLYREFREQRARGLRFHQGLIVRRGWLAWMSVLQLLSVAGRIRLAFSTLALLLLMGLGWTMPAGSATWVAMVAGLLALALTDLWLEAQISKPLQRVLTQALSVAAGNPGTRHQLNRVDEIGMLLRAVNQAGLNLTSLVDDVGEQVGGLRQVTQEIAQGNQDLSARTEQTSANLEETATSMEQMTTSVKTNADSARQASQLAGTASQAAINGKTVIERVTHTMEGIAASSRKISDIINVIDGIAFQTNILALNAAVEAARAGEQGRGFAVVAGEVRSLAQRSASAAKEISLLIKDSVARVDSGSGLVTEAGVAMQEIVQQVSQVAERIQDISTATHEQSHGIGQANAAIGQLDQMTQQNAALVEQSAAAAAHLQQQGHRLEEALAVYRGSGLTLPSQPAAALIRPDRPRLVTTAKPAQLRRLATG